MDELMQWTDVSRIQKLAVYMTQEGFEQTARAAKSRLKQLVCTHSVHCALSPSFNPTAST